MGRIRGPRKDEAFDRWIAWRAACDTVETAYRRWATASVGDRALAFARYCSALEVEERQATSYAAGLGA